MTNRYYFNRKFVKRNKKIRDLRKSRGKKNEIDNNNVLSSNDIPVLRKKHQKRVERLNKIYSSMKVDANKIVNKIPIKRRNKESGKYSCKSGDNNYKNEMEIDN